VLHGQHRGEGEERGRAVAGEGGGAEVEAVEETLAEHRGGAEGGGCDHGPDRGEAGPRAAPVGEGRTEGQQVGAGDGQSGPTEVGGAHPLAEEEGGEPDREHGLELLQQHHHAELVEVDQEERLDDGERAEHAAGGGDGHQRQPAAGVHGADAAQGAGEEGHHEQERHRVQQEHHQQHREVAEAGREDDPVQAPQGRGAANGERSEGGPVHRRAILPGVHARVGRARSVELMGGW